MLKKIEQWVFPYTCFLCGVKSDLQQDLCQCCKTGLPWIEMRCVRCGLELTSGVDSMTCQRCLEKPPAFDRLQAVFSYESPVTDLIMGLKFGQKLSYGRVLGELLAEKVLNDWYPALLPEAIIPVPLHQKRLRKRGYNQALELALPLAKETDIPILTDMFKRIKNTKPQASLNKQYRKRNLKSAFHVLKPIPFEHVVIIDDVVTTGSTVNALASLLKEQGVAMVDIWCIGRA